MCVGVDGAVAPPWPIGPAECGSVAAGELGRTRTLPIQALDLTEDQRRLLERLHLAVPDLDPNDPAILQRIFELGLMAFAAQVGANLGSEEVITQEAGPC